MGIYNSTENLPVLPPFSPFWDNFFFHGSPRLDSERLAGLMLLTNIWIGGREKAYSSAGVVFMESFELDYNYLLRPFTLSYTKKSLHQ